MRPRYAELAEQLIAEIGAGKFAVGAALPTEFELSAQYGVSRATVRSALERVQELGLISRRKRAGIRVESMAPRATFEQPISSVEDLIQFAAVTTRQFVSMKEITASASMCLQLGMPVGSRWLRVEQLRTDPTKPDQPICWTDVYVQAELGEQIKEQVRTQPGLICEMVEKGSGRAVREVRQEIQSVGLSSRLAKKLHAKEGDHALQIARHYLDQDGLVFEVTVSICPAERFTYTLRLKRNI
jgi:GntR family transcriptional regulator